MSITGIVHKKDGSVVKFTVAACDKGNPPCDLREDYIHDSQTMFGQPSKFYPEDVERVEFTLGQVKGQPGFHFAGFVAKDEGCFNDYFTTKSLTGIELRKKLAELLEYKCGFAIETPLEAHFLEEPKTFTLNKKKFIGVYVSLTYFGVLFGLDAPPHHNDSGWVLLDDLEPGIVLTLEDIGTTKVK